MAREIKFRLRAEGKVVGYERHIVDPNSSIGSMLIQHKEVGMEIWRDVVDSDEGGLTDNMIFNQSKEEFTGLVDKNKVEIYENDKVSGMYRVGFYKPQKVIGKIIFDCGCFLVECCIDGEYRTPPIYDFTNLEVVKEKIKCKQELKN